MASHDRSITDGTTDPELDAATQRMLDAMKLLRVGAVFFTRSWEMFMGTQRAMRAGTPEEELPVPDATVLFEGVATLDPATDEFFLTPDGVHLLRLGQQLLTLRDSRAEET